MTEKKDSKHLVKISRKSMEEFKKDPYYDEEQCSLDVWFGRQ